MHNEKITAILNDTNVAEFSRIKQVWEYWFSLDSSVHAGAFEQMCRHFRIENPASVATLFNTMNEIKKLFDSRQISLRAVGVDRPGNFVLCDAAGLPVAILKLGLARATHDVLMSNIASMMNMPNAVAPAIPFIIDINEVDFRSPFIPKSEKEGVINEVGGTRMEATCLTTDGHYFNTINLNKIKSASYAVVSLQPFISVAPGFHLSTQNALDILSLAYCTGLTDLTPDGVIGASIVDSEETYFSSYVLPSPDRPTVHLPVMQTWEDYLLMGDDVEYFSRLVSTLYVKREDFEIYLQNWLGLLPAFEGEREANDDGGLSCQFKSRSTPGSKTSIRHKQGVGFSNPIALVFIDRITKLYKSILSLPLDKTIPLAQVLLNVDPIYADHFADFTGQTAVSPRAKDYQERCLYNANSPYFLVGSRAKTPTQFDIDARSKVLCAIKSAGQAVAKYENDLEAASSNKRKKKAARKLEGAQSTLAELNIQLARLQIPVDAAGEIDCKVSGLSCAAGEGAAGSALLSDASTMCDVEGSTVFPDEGAESSEDDEDVTLLNARKVKMVGFVPAAALRPLPINQAGERRVGELGIFAGVKQAALKATDKSAFIGAGPEGGRR